MTLSEIMAALRDGLSIAKDTTPEWDVATWIVFGYEHDDDAGHLTIHGWGADLGSVRMDLLEDLLLHPEERVLGSGQYTNMVARVNSDLTEDCETPWKQR